MARPFWVRLERGGKSPSFVCVEAETVEGAKALASFILSAPAICADELPYPAQPRIGSRSNTPSFCYAPDTCAGRTSCPKNPACTE